MDERPLEELLMVFGRWLEYIPDAVLVVDPAGAVAAANSLAEQIFGRSRDDLLGLPVEALIPDRHRAAHQFQRGEYQQRPRVRAMGAGQELSALRGDGREFPVAVSLGPLPTRDGMAVLTVIRDLTQRKQEEAVLRDHFAQRLAAKTIQFQALPSAAPRLEGYDIAGLLRPAESIAGDHFDFLQLPDGRLGFVLADVAGHGLDSVRFMAATIARLRGLAQTGHDLEETLRGTNQSATETASPPSFVTVFLGELDPARRTWRYSSAGHTACFIQAADGQLKARMEATSLPLAVLPEARFPAADPMSLEPGDVILLLSDGVLEARGAGGTLFGEQRVLQTLRGAADRPAKAMLEQLFATACHFAPDENPPDDLAAVLIKVL